VKNMVRTTVVSTVKLRKLHIDVMDAIVKLGRYTNRSEFIRDAIRRYIDDIRSGEKRKCSESELETLTYKVFKIPVLSYKIDQHANIISFTLPEQLVYEISSIVEELRYPSTSKLIREAIVCRIIDELRLLENKDIFEYKESGNVKEV